ncbi:MAG: hypothetical protein COV48_04590 [Elusimicrobia bacterium CG11_big_fil_rev_8_21_14_0_20_64_6]|nr:MAG: hypothetical protein COV48_04590 [Elusimicrobia bacterium CG11_big_fil_rev_8_21_14_0_20_64_6]
MSGVLKLGDRWEEGYFPPFSSAQVAGLAALYLSIHADASPGKIREALKNAAIPIKTATRFRQGAGIVDARRLIMSANSASR